MFVVIAVLSVFIVMEAMEMMSASPVEGLERAPVEKKTDPDPIAEERSYEIGNRLIHVFCVAMFGLSYYYFGMLGAFLGLVPLFLVAAALDAFWIRVCLQRTSVPLPSPRASRHRSRREKRASR